MADTETANQLVEIGKLIADIGLGGMSLALFFKLGQVVANHEIRITTLEIEKDEPKPVSSPRRKRR